MLGYRLYFLNDDGHICGAVDLLCDSDTEAIVAAETQRKGAPIEIWSGPRFVVKMDGERDGGGTAGAAGGPDAERRSVSGQDPDPMVRGAAAVSGLVG